MRIVTSVLVLASVACAIPTPNEESGESGPNPHYGGYYGGYYGYRPYYGYGYGWWGRKKRSTEEAVAAVPEDIEDVNIAPRDEAPESGPHYGGYYGYRGYYGYPYYGGYWGWGRKKRSTEDVVGDDISEGEIESGPHGYYGWGGYGWGGYRGYYGYPYYRGYGWYGRKKRNAEETIGDDISEGEEEAGPNPHYGYYYGGYRPWGYRGYGWGGYWGGYGYPYWG